MAAGLRISTAGFEHAVLADLFLDGRFLSLFFFGLALWDLDFLVLVGCKNSEKCTLGFSVIHVIKLSSNNIP